MCCSWRNSSLTPARAAEDAAQQSPQDLPADLAADGAGGLLGHGLHHALTALGAQQQVAQRPAAFRF